MGEFQYLTINGTTYTVATAATFLPSVSQEGVLSWTNNKGLENPTPVNIKGPAGADGTTPHIGANGNWFLGDTDTGQPSVVLENGKYQYAKKDNQTDGYFWHWDSSRAAPFKYAYADYTVLEPITLQAGTYYLSTFIRTYSWLVNSAGVQSMTNFVTAEQAKAGCVLTLEETSTIYLGYYTPSQVSETTPYVVRGTQPLETGEYYEGEEILSLEKLLNYKAFDVPYIRNCQLVANKLNVSGNNHGHYTGVKMDGHITKLMCKARLVSNGTVALITTDLGSATVTNVTFGSIHLVFGLNSCAVGVFDTKDTLRGIQTFPYTVTEGAEVAFGFDVDEATSTLTVYLPNGTTKTVTDEAFAACNGQYAIWEHYCNTASGEFASCAMTKLYCKDATGQILDDDLKRLDGAIGVAPTGQPYRQFTSYNLNNRDFK